MNKLFESKLGWATLLLVGVSACDGEIRVLGTESNVGGASGENSEAGASSIGGSSSATQGAGGHVAATGGASIAPSVTAAAGASAVAGSTHSGGTTSIGSASTTGKNLVASCDIVPHPAQLSISACMQPTGGWPFAEGTVDSREIPRAYSYRFAGTITSVATGLSEHKCIPVAEVLSKRNLAYLTVETEVDGILQSYDIEYQVENESIPFATGDDVDVEFSYEMADFQGAKYGLIIQGKTREKYVYIAKNTNLSSLPKGPYSFEQGALSAKCSVTCGNMEYYNLRVSDPFETTEVAPGKSSEVDSSSRVYNGMLLNGVPVQPYCMDWSANNVTVAIIRTTLL